MRQSFLITGMGRSGTKFLASALNTSLTWNVEHEPLGDGDSRDLAFLRFRNARRYGEVNSRLRDWFLDVPAGKRAVVIRNPYEVVVSVYNRHPDNTVERLSGVWELLESYICQGARIFRFEEFTRNSNEIEKIAEWCGIDDLKLTDDDLRPKNATTSKLVTEFAQIPKDVRRQMERAVDRFANAFNYSEPGTRLEQPCPLRGEGADARNPSKSLEAKA
jgi:hypothetical protein